MSSAVFPWVRLPQPRTFAGLMDLYEANYLSLRKLIPDLRGVGRRAVSRVPGSPELHLEILERHKYTTSLSLTYYFEDGEALVPDPDLRICIYHDARQAEARSLPAHRRRLDMADLCGMLERKWEMNLFLDKWLTYCLAQGHRFVPQERERCASMASSPGYGGGRLVSLDPTA